MKYSVGGSELLGELIFWRMAFKLMEIGDQIDASAKDPEFFLAYIPVEDETDGDILITAACIRRAEDAPSVKNALALVMHNTSAGQIHVRMPFLTGSLSGDPEMCIACNEEEFGVRYLDYSKIQDDEKRNAYHFLARQLMDAVESVSTHDITVYNSDEKEDHQ